MKNWENHPKKLLRIGPDPFFPLTSLGHSPRPKIDFPYHEISGPDICSLICVNDSAHTIDEPPSNEGAVIIACWKSREFPETDSFNLL